MTQYSLLLLDRVYIYIYTLILAYILHFYCVTTLKSMSQPVKLSPYAMVCLILGA